MWRYAVLAVVTGAFLAGCSRADREFAVYQPPPASVEVGVVPVTPPMPQGSLPLPKRKPPRFATAPLVEASPIQLVGLTESEAERLLGKPTVKQEKPPARVWTYNAKDCSLSIFFYADINTKEFRALTYEVIGPDTAEGTTQPCLEQLKSGT